MTRPPIVAGPAGLEAAAAALRRGEVVAIPTDTVYGVAVDPWAPGAADRLFAAKQRPRSVALPVLVAGVEQAEATVGALDARARRLAERWWPGPLTVVVDRPADFGADLGDADGVGLRSPAHPVPLALAAAVGPIATTSANRHREPPLTTAADVAARLTGVVLVVDGGRCEGAPSTVVDCRGPEVQLLRAGGVAWREVRATLEPPFPHRTTATGRDLE